MMIENVSGHIWLLPHFSAFSLDVAYLILPVTQRFALSESYHVISRKWCYCYFLVESYFNWKLNKKWHSQRVTIHVIFQASSVQLILNWTVFFQEKGWCNCYLFVGTAWLLKIVGTKIVKLLNSIGAARFHFFFFFETGWNRVTRVTTCPSIPPVQSFKFLPKYVTEFWIRTC